MNHLRSAVRIGGAESRPRIPLARGAAVVVGCLLCAFIAAPSTAQRIRADQTERAGPSRTLVVQRVETLKRTSDLFRNIATTPPPGDLSREDQAQARSYAAWLQHWSTRLDALAAQGESIIGGDATRTMQETQMSFNLQYLQLQNTMQDENRQFTMVSNIMKTKHDTVKNSISNIR